MLKKLKYDLYASLGTSDFYNSHGVEVYSNPYYSSVIVCCLSLQTKAVEWPFGDNNSSLSNSSYSTQTTSLHNIADYFAQRKIDMVINLPLRQHRYCNTLHIATTIFILSQSHYC